MLSKTHFGRKHRKKVFSIGKKPIVPQSSNAGTRNTQELIAYGKTTTGKLHCATVTSSKVSNWPATRLSSLRTASGAGMFAIKGVQPLIPAAFSAAFELETCGGYRFPSAPFCKVF